MLLFQYIINICLKTEHRMPRVFCCCDGVKDYKNRWAHGNDMDRANNERIKDFMKWDQGEALSKSDDKFAIQAVTKENFGPTLNIAWYRRESDGFVLDETDNSGQEFKRSNNYKNFTCKEHTRFFELNLYTQDGISYHHESTRAGNTYARDASLDHATGTCIKGKHWRNPAI
jgi:hypothetical protein